MCGRFALVTEKYIIEMLYDMELRADFDLQPRYNIAPSQEVPGLRLAPGGSGKELVELKWGLVPFWADDESIGNRMINARAETAAEKPAFRDAFKKRRLLIPATGFYEWKKEGSSKRPYYIFRRDNRPFSLAGLWERWEKGSKQLETFTILTTEPNELVAALHNRMPVIISPDEYERWLDPSTLTEDLVSMLTPYPADEFYVRPVSRLVNNPANDSPAVLEEVSS
ncbi:MAG: hypothetical protein AVO34_08100 [Firmicutes bacterium ML8_F2]|nr:MAG: hypothetical protein AVO34_08100 [Firmicutes bacterium ML8_F2]